MSATVQRTLARSNFPSAPRRRKKQRVEDGRLTFTPKSADYPDVGTEAHVGTDAFVRPPSEARNCTQPAARRYLNAPGLLAWRMASLRF
jgi:hypothetical protein